MIKVGYLAFVRLQRDMYMIIRYLTLRFKNRPHEILTLNETSVDTMLQSYSTTNKSFTDLWGVEETSVSASEGDSQASVYYHLVEHNPKGGYSRRAVSQSQFDDTYYHIYGL